jgi:hypothetical protein
MRTGKENMRCNDALPGFASAAGKRSNPARHRASVAEVRQNCHKTSMCYHASLSGVILPVWSKTGYDEVMLHCARIGFKP